jgi:hypothetical protein
MTQRSFLRVFEVELRLIKNSYVLRVFEVELRLIKLSSALRVTFLML